MTEIQPTVLASGLDHPEGLAWSDTHGLFAGGELGQIYRIDPVSGESVQIASTGGFALGMAFGPDGRLMVCDMAKASVLAVDVATGVVEPWSDALGIRFHVPNHLAYDSRGSLFVSDSGDWGSDNGRIIRVDADGTHHVVADGGAFTNGLALTPDESHLVAVESSAGRVVSYRIEPEALLLGEVVAEMPGTVPDGVAYCDDGTLLVSCYRPDAIFSVPPGGSPAPLVHDWTGLTLSAPTNIAFVGAGRDTLVTANLCGRHLSRVAIPGRGRVLPYTT